MVALLGEPADHQLAGVEIVLEIGHEAAPGHIWIGAFPGNILADPVDDQHIDIIKPEAREAGFCDLEELAVPADDLVVGINADIRYLIVRVLHHTDSEDDIHFVQKDSRCLRDVLRKGVKAAPVQTAAAAMFCQADGHHLEKAALVLPFEVSVGFHLVVDDDPVRFRSQAVAAYGRARSVIQLPDLHHVHARAHRNTDILLGDPIAGQDLQIAFRRASSMTAHGRNDEGVCPPFLKLVADRPHDPGITGDPPAADGHRYSLALHKRGIIISREFRSQMGGNVLDPVLVIELSHPNHAGQDHLIQPLYRKVDFRKINIDHDISPPDLLTY